MSKGWAIGSNGAILNTIDGGGVIIPPRPPDSTYKVNHVGQSKPNPFLPGRNPFALIPFRLKMRSDVVVKIYDALGRLIRSIDAGNFDPGIHDESNGAPGWDGRTRSARPPPPASIFTEWQRPSSSRPTGLSSSGNQSIKKNMENGKAIT